MPDKPSLKATSGSMTALPDELPVKPDSNTPLVDAYLKRLYEGQRAISVQTVAEKKLPPSLLIETAPPVWTPDQRACLKNMGDCIAAAREAERRGNLQEMDALMRTFPDLYEYFLRAMCDRDE